MEDLLCTTPHFALVWNHEDPGVVEEHFRNIVRDFDLETPDSTAIHVEITTQIARAQGLQSKFDQAQQTIDIVREFVDASLQVARLTSIDKAMLNGRVDLEQGRIFRSSKRVPESVPHFQAASKGCENFKELDYFQVDALHMLALVLPTQEEKNQATEKALAIARDSANPLTRAWAGALLNNKAWDKIDAGHVQDAVSLFQEASEFRKETYQFKIADSKNSIQPDISKALKAWRIARYSYGHALRLAGEKEKALEEQEALLASGHDGPFLREELAVLLADPQIAAANHSMAANHARRALELGFSVDTSSSDRVIKLKKISESSA